MIRFLLIYWCFFVTAGFGATNSVVAPSFLYGVDLDFLFLDELAAINRPAKIDGPLPAMSTDLDVPSAMSPTLGLRASRLNLEWRFSRGVSVQLVLRPDAAGAGTYREVDTRAGRVVEESPSIHFLDEYRLLYRAASSVVKFGVEREILESFRVTPDMLDFGLRVRGPEKAMVMGCDIPHLTLFDEGHSNSFMGVSIAALSGRDERHDARYQDLGGIGESPAKKDPYWGGTLATSLVFGGDTRLGLALALMEERVDGIKVRDQWYQAGLRRSVATSDGGHWLVAMEARQLRQGFHVEGTNISDVSMSSIGVTSSYERHSGEGPMLGLWIGSGDIHPLSVLSQSKPTKATQANFGWHWTMEDFIGVSAMVSREWRRDGSELGGSHGGFAHGDSHRSAISRLAVSVRYLLGGQI